MLVICDIETEALHNPQKIWVIVCKEVESGEVHVFREPQLNPKQFKDFCSRVSGFIGHNILSFDIPHIVRLLDVQINPQSVIDTLIVSRLLNTNIEGGHSLEAWGQRLGHHKLPFKDFSQLTEEMIEYCKQDVETNYQLYLRFKPFLFSKIWKKSLRLEHDIAHVCYDMHVNGFSFDTTKAELLYKDIYLKVSELEAELQRAFPPRSRLIREITPRSTKHGTLHRQDFRWLEGDDLTPFSPGSSFSLFEFVPFNPRSPTQVVERMNEAGWTPYEKTKGHIAAERAGDMKKLRHYAIYGWKVSEANLETLPSIQKELDWNEHCRIKIPSSCVHTNAYITSVTKNKSGQPHADTTMPIKNITETKLLNEITKLVLTTITPWQQHSTTAAEFVEKSNHLWSITITETGAYVDCSAACATGSWAGMNDSTNLRQIISTHNGARKLVQYLTLSNRYSVLTEWLNAAVRPSNRIHGTFNSIGAWTHRMSHSNPNMANIPSGGSLYADEFRSLWTVPADKLLVGVDADGIQLRVLAHYMNDSEFTAALVSGDKAKGTDPHTLNKNALGEVCRDRDVAKTFIYAWLLGASAGKVAQILGCSIAEAKEAIANFLKRYPGLKQLKTKQIPADAKRGYFEGFDGRLVLCDSEHLMLAGYLQNGESVIMKTANLIWRTELQRLKIPFKQVNFVHDEWQTEVQNDMDIATKVAEIQADAIRQAGEVLNLRCPMAGSIMNAHKKLAIGRTWSETH